MAWARIDDGFHDHPKVDELSLAAVGLWTLSLTWAHRHRKTAILPGHITEARARKIAGRQADTLVAELVAARLWDVETGIGGWVIHDFADYLPRERDPDERREAGRKGAASRWKADSKTDGKDDGNLPADSMASDSSRASAPASPSRPVPEGSNEPSRPRKRATRLPDDWRPTDADVEWQRARGISDLLARRCFEKFGNYWRAKSGKDATKLDWSATWRNWLLTEQDRQPASTARPDRPAGWEFGGA